MDTGTIAAICVTIFGFFIVIAGVWLFYQYRLTCLARDATIVSSPPMRKLIVHRGRVVPASKLATPSIRSGWTSLKHRSWLLATPVQGKANDISFSYPPPVPEMYQTPSDLEAGVWRSKDATYPAIHTVLESPRASFEQSRTDAATIPYIPSQVSLPTLKGSGFWTARYPLAGSSEEKRSAARTFLDDASVASLPTFPRPPYLSPLQSRYHVLRTPKSASALSHNIRPSHSSYDFNEKR